MQYNININQRILSKTDLDIIDAAILEYVYHYCNSKNEKIKKNRIVDKNNEELTWIDYQTLIQDMPLLRLKSSGTITTRINKLEKNGYIVTRREKHMKKYFRMTALADELYIQFDAKAIHQDEQGLFTKMNRAIHPDESTIIDNNNNTNNTDISETVKEHIEEIYEEYSLNINKRSRLTNSAKKKIATRLKECSIEELEKAIMNFSRDNWWMTHNAHRGVAWFFHSEDRIDQFINLEPEDKKEKLNL